MKSNTIWQTMTENEWQNICNAITNIDFYVKNHDCFVAKILSNCSSDTAMTVFTSIHPVRDLEKKIIGFEFYRGVDVVNGIGNRGEYQSCCALLRSIKFYQITPDHGMIGSCCAKL